MIYTFKGGSEIVQIKVNPATDLFIRCNNQLLKTGKDFVSINKLLGDEKTKKLEEALKSVYENYLAVEFGKMGYGLINKNDDNK